MAGKSPEQVAADLEKATDAIWNAEFLLVVAGPLFDEGMRNPFDSEYCDPSLVAKANRFMGFWGGLYNQYSDRNPHEGFAVLGRWRDRYFCQDDARKKGKKKQEEETELDRLPRCAVVTTLIGNQFQRLGIPMEEVYDVMGNISQWQCSRNPPCCNRVAPVERGFRFVIDEATKEAMPVKYVTSKPSDKGTERIIVVDSDEEELVAMSGGATKNPFEVKLSKEERYRRQQRRFDQPRVIHHHPTTQAGRERFPDLFQGYALTPGTHPFPYAFPETPMDPESPKKMPVRPEDAVELSASASAMAATGLHRCSHLLEHVKALDLHTYDASIGNFSVVEPERFTKEREQYYTALNRIFIQDNHAALLKRIKYVTYNISVFIKPSDSPHDILNPLLREKLLAVYSKSAPTIPVVNAEGEVVSALTPSQAAVAELKGEHLDSWVQGYKGWLYFSNQTARHTMQEPTHDTLIDVVHIPFPLNADGVGDVQLPDQCQISIIVETVLDLPNMPPVAEGKNAPAPSPSASVGQGTPCRFVNTWQVVGNFTKNSFADAEFKGKDNVEYVLVGRDHHGVRVGVAKSAPDCVRYMQVQCPAIPHYEQLDGTAAGDPSLGSAFVTHVAFTKQTVAPERKTLDAGGKERPPVPSPNHQMCTSCHDIARPFVLMAKAGVKDDGFCHGLMAARMKNLKNWEKLMSDAMKADTSKSIVILEVGCDKKVDAARSYSEKTFKTLKQSKCTFVRLSSQDLETKAKGGAEEGNSIVLVTNPTQALVTIDNALNDRMRKGR